MSAFYEDYQTIKRVAQRYYQDHNMCAVIAVALAAEVGYGKAFHTLRRLGRVHQQGTYRHTQLEALKELGKNVDVSYELRGKHVKSMPKALPKGTHMVFINRHVLVCREGEIIDWTAGRSHRVQEVWTIS